MHIGKIFCNLALPPLPNYYPTYDIIVQYIIQDSLFRYFFWTVTSNSLNSNLLSLHYQKYIRFSIHILQQLKFIIEMNCFIKTTLYVGNDLPSTHFSFHQNLILNPWMCLLPYCRCLCCVLKANIEISNDVM